VKLFSIPSRLLLAVSALLIYPAAFAQQNPSTSKQEALQDERQGANADAGEIWRRITIQDPLDAEAWSHLGLVLALQEKYADAVPAYRHALQLNPKLPGVQLDLGLALFKQEHFTEAILAFKAAEKEAPTDTKPRLLLGMSYYGAAQYAEAVPYFQLAVKTSPENLQLRTTLAQSCLWSRQYPCVLEQYKQILQIDPQSAQADMLAGEASDGLGDTAQAIADFRDAEKVSPDAPDLHFGLGYLLWKQHQYPDARTEFEQEIHSSPNHAQALTYLGDIAIKDGDSAHAREYLERAIAQPGPAIRLAYMDLGILNASQSRNQEAESDFLRAIQIGPNEPDAHWRLAHLYQSMGRKADATAELAKVSQLHQEKDQGLVQRMTGSPLARPPQ
jgi:tetratricopeptide (TPR) repeat protein